MIARYVGCQLCDARFKFLREGWGSDSMQYMHSKRGIIVLPIKKKLSQINEEQEHNEAYKKKVIMRVLSIYHNDEIILYIDNSLNSGNFYCIKSPYYITKRSFSDEMFF